MGVEVVLSNDPTLQIIQENETPEVVSVNGEVVVISDPQHTVEVGYDDSEHVIITEGQVVKTVLDSQDILSLPASSSLPISIENYTGQRGATGPPGAAGATSWAGITDKPTTFPPEAHDHNGVYYTKMQTDAALTNKAEKIDFQNHIGSVDAHGLGDIPNLTLLFENGLI